MLGSQIMPSRHVGNHCTRRDGLANDPPLLLIAPPPTANHARHFRTAPNHIRVVTNVDHNVHTIPTESRSCTIRLNSAMWGENTAYLAKMENRNKSAATRRRQLAGDTEPI
jgi:hypothetical protein